MQARFLTKLLWLGWQWNWSEGRLMSSMIKARVLFDSVMLPGSGGNLRALTPPGAGVKLGQKGGCVPFFSMQHRGDYGFSGWDLSVGQQNQFHDGMWCSRGAGRRGATSTATEWVIQGAMGVAAPFRLSGYKMMWNRFHLVCELHRAQLYVYLDLT